MHIHPSHSTVHRSGSRDDVRVPFTRVALTNGETFDRYCTEGPGSEPEHGLPPRRDEWIEERGDT
ncbi:MAG: phosphomethylpyrimidine synthase ThiC, partial [Nocardioidaceae bacterium]